MLKWLGATSQSDKQEQGVESPSRTSARSGTPEETGKGRVRGISHRNSISASHESSSDKQGIPDQPESSGMESRAREHARQSRKRPLADPDGSDAEDASVPELASPAPATFSGRRPRVPSRPSGASSSARPPGKPTSPEALPRSMGVPAQPLPVRPSHRDAAPAGPPRKADDTGAADGPERKPTLRQTYNFQTDLEKQPKLSDASTSGGSGHYDPTNQMILRLEYLTETDVKWAIFFIHMSEFVGLVILVLYLVAKLKMDDNYFIRDNTLVVVNLCFGVLLWLALMEAFVIYMHNMVRTIRLRRQWSDRRYKSTVILLIEIIAQITNLCFFIVPNAYVLARPCGWRDPIVLWSNFVMFSCWNTLFLIFVVRVHNINLWLDKDGQPRGGRSDATLVDASWMIHAPKLLLWAAAEAFKAAAIVGTIQKAALRPYYIPPEAAGDCRTWLYECHHDPIVQLMLILESVTLLIYLAFFLLYLARAFRQLSVRNVRDFRMGNQSARLILRTRLGAIIFFAACLIVFYYVRVGSCATWISSALGYLPMHVVMTANGMVMLWWFMPKDPDEQDQVLQAWLQEFAWTEAEKLQKWKKRAGNLRLTSAALHDLNKEPMFCFESAIKLYYYSHIIYQYHKLEGFQSAGGADEKKDEVTHIGMFRRQLARSFGHLRRSSVGPTDPSAAGDRSQHDPSSHSGSAGIYREGSAAKLADGPVTDGNLATGPNPSATAAKVKAASKASPGTGSHDRYAHGGKGAKRSGGQPRAEELSLDTAMRLYGLERMEVMWERRLDTMALIAWGNNRIVVVFRGTNSLKNVLADLEAWQTAFPPNQASNHFWERPCVHNGFYRSYTANDFGKKIVRRVCELVSSHDWDWTKIYCTGHSLGGALALLAAYDISRAMEWVSRPTKVICYTFGAPRVGNHAFAHTYNKMVPETWSVVNDQDAVARRFKLCFLYKRPGQRVIINRRGDMLVRPTFIELTLNQTPFSSSVQDHFLLSYRDALAEICRAQMNRKKRLEGGLAGVLSLLEGDEFVRGILEPAGLTMEDLARPSIDPRQKISIPPPPTEGPIPSKRAPSLGAPLPPPSPFQAAMPEPSKGTGIELQQQHYLDRSSSSSASSYKTAYAQSFVSSLSTDDVTAPGGPGLGSARPSSDTDISLAGIAHEKSGALSDAAWHTGTLDSSVTGTADQRAGLTPDTPQHGDGSDIAGMGSTGTAAAQASRMQSIAKGDSSTAHRHLNGHGPHLDSEPSYKGMEHSLGLNEDVGPRGSFPGFWQNTKGEDAAAAGLAAATAAGAASFAAGKDTPNAQGSEHSSHSATSDTSMAAADSPGGAVQAREQAPHRGSSASDAMAAAASSSATAEDKGEHDLMVATGYTGPSGLLRRRDGMSGQQAIEQLLKAQRTGGSVAPEVRIAAAYALANGAADAKQRRDAKLKALKTAPRQGPPAEEEPAFSKGAGSEAAPATSDLRSSFAPGAAVPMSTGAFTSSAQRSGTAKAAGPAAEAGSPQRSARALEPQPNTPRPYRVNPEFYRAGSGGSPSGRPGTVRFADADATTAGVVDGEPAVPLPSSHRLAGVQPAAEELPETLETRSGSWLGWLPWTRATDSPRAADALSSAERGEHSGTGPAMPAPAAQTSTSGSSRADATSAPGHRQTVQNDGVEPERSTQSAGADVALPLTPEKAAPPRTGAAPVEHDQALPASGAAQTSGAAAVTSAAGLEADRHVEADAGSSQAVHESADSPYSGLSYSAFYPEEPEESSSQGAWPVRDDTDDPFTAGEGSLSLWGRQAAVQPRADADASASLQQPASNSIGAALQPRPVDDPTAFMHQPLAHGLEASSEQSRAPESEKASMPGWREAGPENPRGTKSEGQEHFVAAPNVHGLDGAASQRPEAGAPFRFMGSGSAPSTPTRSSKRKPGRRSSLLAPTSPRREGSQDLSICSPSRSTQDAGSEEDISPRTRAMSRYLSGRLGSSALASPAQSRATTPEKPQAQAPVLETPSRAALAPAAMGSDSSPPRIRRKATPRELAEQFRGHGLKQAEWAPIPIYWAKDGSPAAAPNA